MSDVRERGLEQVHQRDALGVEGEFSRRFEGPPVSCHLVYLGQYPEESIELGFKVDLIKVTVRR